MFRTGIVAVLALSVISERMPKEQYIELEKSVAYEIMNLYHVQARCGEDFKNESLPLETRCQLISNIITQEKKILDGYVKVLDAREYNKTSELYQKIQLALRDITAVADDELSIFEKAKMGEGIIQRIGMFRRDFDLHKVLIYMDRNPPDYDQSV